MKKGDESAEGGYLNTNRIAVLDSLLTYSASWPTHCKNLSSTDYRTPSIENMFHLCASGIHASNVRHVPRPTRHRIGAAAAFVLSFLRLPSPFPLSVQMSLLPNPPPPPPTRINSIKADLPSSQTKDGYNGCCRQIGIRGQSVSQSPLRSESALFALFDR